MAQLINEAKRFQKLAGLINESPNMNFDKIALDYSNTSPNTPPGATAGNTPSPSAITTKIDQNLDKIQNLSIVKQTAEKIMNDPKLLQQFQQGLSKMGVNIDLMKENEDVSSDVLSKIINAAVSKEKQLQEEEETDDVGGAIMRGFFGMPLLLAALDAFTDTDIIGTITKGMGTNAGFLAVTGVGALIGGIVGHIAYKKRQKKQQSQQESINIESTVNEALTKFRKGK
jgi:hypothetical protein